MHSTSSRRLIPLGLLLLALRSMLQQVIDRGGHTTDLSDFLLGVLLGIGLGITLFGIWHLRGGSCAPNARG